MGFAAGVDGLATEFGSGVGVSSIMTAGGDNGDRVGISRLCDLRLLVFVVVVDSSPSLTAVRSFLLVVLVATLSFVLLA